MAWNAVSSTYLAVVETLPGLVATIDDPGRHALGTWDVAGLAGHLLRTLTTPLTYLDAPEPAGEPLADTAAYFAAYLQWRAQDPTGADAAVADRGTATLAGVDPDSWVTEFTAAAAATRSRLEDESGDRRLPSPFGVLRLSDYIRTRTLEATVHGLDLARAVDAGWEPPAAAALDALRLLMEVGARTGSGPALLMVLTGRRGIPVDSVIPILR